MSSPTKSRYGKPPKTSHGVRQPIFLWTPSINPKRRRPRRKKRRKWERRKERPLFTAKDIDLVDILLCNPSLDECPDIEAAWNATRREGRAPDAKILAAQLRVGRILLNLEKHTDFTAKRQRNGTILGRAPGLKGWIKQHCPALLPKYKALMAYKSTVKRLCALLGIEGSVAENKVADIRKTCRNLFQEGIPVSLTSLEIATRLKLGMMWMRRRRRPHKDMTK